MSAPKFLSSANFPNLAKPKQSLKAFLPITLGCIAMTSSVAVAIQLADGTVYFAQAPRLVAASATFKAPYSPSTYFFTLDLPSTAGEPLQRITLNQAEGGEAIAFDLSNSYAYAGTRDREGKKLPLESITQDPKTKVVSVLFSPPITPGTQITLSLTPVRNPSISGVYLFGITAFPAGEKAYGQFIGYGRLQFYSGGRGGMR